MPVEIKSSKQTYLQRLAAQLEPVADAAERLNVSRQRVHELIACGELEAVQIGKNWFVSSLSLQERLDKFPDRRTSIS